MTDLGDGPAVFLWFAWGLAGVIVALVVGSLRTKPKPPAPSRPGRAANRTSSPKESTPKSTPREAGKSEEPATPHIPRLDHEEDEEVEPTKIGSVPRIAQPIYQAPVKSIVVDAGADRDEAEGQKPVVATRAFAQTDPGLRRKRNEDSFLVDEERALYVVADGMGGYSGGELASKLAVSTIAKAFETGSFDGAPHEGLNARASDLARAIQMANAAVHEKAQGDARLEGMGTTVVAAWFSASKQRLYIGHIGDSRVYRVRDGALEQMTADHTMKDFGVEGPQSAHLSRAVGVWPVVPVDVLFVKPEAGDVYLLCSDGLTKMVSDKDIERTLSREKSPAAAVAKLVDAANANGGKDNVTIVMVRVESRSS